MAFAAWPAEARARAARAARTPTAIAGVSTVRLEPRRDSRGTVMESFRAEWKTGFAPAQWSALVSEPGVLRGLHVHPRHMDYVALVAGRCTTVLCDLRPASPDHGAVVVLEQHEDTPLGITIPNGVLHGFLYHEPTVQLLGLSHGYDPEDELGCRFDDPELAIPWPAPPRQLSPRDRGLPSLAELRAALATRAGA